MKLHSLLQKPHRGRTVARSTGARGWLLALFAALLFSPFLGQVHSVLHPAALPGQHVVHGNAATGVAPAGVESGAASGTTHGLSGALAGLFSGHDSGDCRLYDQFSHGDQNVTIPFVALPVAFAPVLVAVDSHGNACLTPPASRARGPPALR